MCRILKHFISRLENPESKESMLLGAKIQCIEKWVSLKTIQQTYWKYFKIPQSKWRPEIYFQTKKLTNSSLTISNSIRHYFCWGHPFPHTPGTRYTRQKVHGGQSSVTPYFTPCSHRSERTGESGTLWTRVTEQTTLLLPASQRGQAVGTGGEQATKWVPFFIENHGLKNGCWVLKENILTKKGLKYSHS